MVPPCGDFRGDGCEVMKSSTIYKLTHLFGGTSSATMTQGFAVKLNSVTVRSKCLLVDLKSITQINRSKRP